MKIIVFTLSITFLVFSFFYGSEYRINNLSQIDGVFANFRDTIVKFNKKGSFSKYIDFKFKLALYKVKKKDTLNNIASRLGLDTDSLISLNALSSSYDVYEGKELYIPNIRGTFIYLEESSDRGSISSLYNVPLWLLLSLNEIKRKILYKGERVFIPHRKLSLEERKYFASSIFRKPISSGYLSSSFGTRLDPFRNKMTFHGGLDIAAFRGSPVYSALGGRVSFAGYKGAYGKLIVISHRYNYKTLYGHLSKILVKKGSLVHKGQFIGRVGSTGRSTGPHLHFEIRRFNSRVDPSRFVHIK